MGLSVCELSGQCVSFEGTKPSEMSKIYGGEDSEYPDCPNLDKYYDYILMDYNRQMGTPNDVETTLAERIVFTIFDDIKNRKGVGNELESYDHEIQEMILSEQLEAISKLLAENQ